MSRQMRFTICVLVCILLSLGVALAQTEPLITGQWTIGTPVERDQVSLTLQRTNGNSTMSESSPVDLSRLRGLSRAQFDSSGSLVRFELIRDAGSLRFDGYTQRGGGGGVFTFAPNANFAGRMRSFGYPAVLVEKLFTLAVYDVSATYLTDIGVAGIHPESIDQLIRLKGAGVDGAYIRQIRGAGFDLTVDNLIRFRGHGITLDFVNAIKETGLQGVTSEGLIRLTGPRVDPAWIRRVQSLGYPSLSVDDVVRLRGQGITPEYIREAQKRFKDVSINDLIRLKGNGIL